MLTHIDHAFQASSPKNFIGSAFGLALFLSAGWPVAAPRKASSQAWQIL
jgi:hypothetical protein